ncbi:DUF721 domain-containing protein [Candidatus Bipolaricaulota bacterium]|nr:DUF721 domain-containing protein [Candidatus Bipolaricaulota bacterium]MBS3814559.1 DUF721 domain-containing protein [Candidatus Bipolaricaulota bacterium]MBS3825932.1 DUF721 domain-containing protein [Candidatus Bipolaricaulota bacterium]
MTLDNDILSAIFRRNNLLGEYEEQEPIFVWTEVAGEIGKIARPKKVKGNSLVLEVPSAAAKQELSFLKEEFLEKLNENLEYAKIDNLRFELGQFTAENSGGSDKFDLSQVSLTEEEQERIDNAVSREGLERKTRISLKNLLLTQQKKRKLRLENGWKECPSCGGIFPEDKCSYCGFQTSCS